MVFNYICENVCLQQKSHISINLMFINQPIEIAKIRWWLEVVNKNPGPKFRAVWHSSTRRTYNLEGIDVP